MSQEAEHIERRALAELHEAAPPTLRQALGLETVEIDDVLVSIAAKAPASAIVANRTIGLGLDAPADAAVVDEIVKRYGAAGVARYFVHWHPESTPAAARQWLLDRGLEKARGWMKFQRGREAPPQANSTLQVRLAAPSDATAFGRIVTDAFDCGDAAADWLACLISAPNWHAYMSFDGDRPAGAGSMYVADGIAWLDWGATAPDFRQRGGQSALLARRIADALDLGCHTLLTATGEEVPGDPQHSYKNILRMGFREAYVRENYAPPRQS